MCMHQEREVLLKLASVLQYPFKHFHQLLVEFSILLPWRWSRLPLMHKYCLVVVHFADCDAVEFRDGALQAQPRPWHAHTCCFTLAASRLQRWVGSSRQLVLHALSFVLRWHLIAKNSCASVQAYF